VNALTLRNVEIDGHAGLDVRLQDGRVAAIGERLPGRGDDLDGRGGALIPGLIDHHIHLFATAAQRDGSRPRPPPDPSAPGCE
jgi:cytosine/adenosine deaminase-related metal-dependent hydrolase